MKINSNIQALITNNVLKNNEDRLSTSSEKLSSGYKINAAMDNPAGMAISNRMNAQIMSLKKANQNSKNAISAIQTAEGALSEIESMVQRINELAVKGSNGTMTSADRDAINKEVSQLCEEIERIAGETEYNTQNLLNGEQDLKGYSDKAAVSVRNYNTQFPFGDYKINIDATGKVTDAHVASDNTTKALPTGWKSELNEVDNSIRITTPDSGELVIDFKDAANDVTLNLNGVGGMKIQVGTSEGQEIQVVIPEISLRNLSLEGIDCRTEEGCRKAIEQANAAVEYVSSARSKVGAYQNRFEATISNLDISDENLTNAYSTIKDVDMAEEMVDYTRLQVLVQAGTSMLTQANEQPQQALQLLQ